MAAVYKTLIIQLDVTQILSHSSGATHAWPPGIRPCSSSLMTSGETGEMPGGKLG